MTMQIYVVVDRVAEESGPLFEARNDGVALRNLNLMLQKVEGAGPRDFILLRLGSINHNTNEIIQEAVPVVVDQVVEKEFVG